MTNLNIKFACLSNIIKLILPFNYPTNVDTPIFGEKTMWYLQCHFVCV